jgi:uncharacterized protein YuzE
MRSKRSNIKARYDAEADAAYINFAPGLPGGRTTTNCESPLGDFTTINLDSSDDDRLVGIEVFGASRRLPPDLLDLAD